MVGSGHMDPLLFPLSPQALRQVLGESSLRHLLHWVLPPKNNIILLHCCDAYFVVTRLDISFSVSLSITSTVFLVPSPLLILSTTYNIYNTGEKKLEPHTTRCMLKHGSMEGVKPHP